MTNESEVLYNIHADIIEHSKPIHIGTLEEVNDGLGKTTSLTDEWLNFTFTYSISTENKLLAQLSLDNGDQLIFELDESATNVPIFLGAFARVGAFKIISYNCKVGDQYMNLVEHVSDNINFLVSFSGLGSFYIPHSKTVLIDPNLIKSNYSESNHELRLHLLHEIGHIFGGTKERQANNHLIALNRELNLGIPREVIYRFITNQMEASKT